KEAMWVHFILSRCCFEGRCPSLKDDAPSGLRGPQPAAAGAILQRPTASRYILKCTRQCLQFVPVCDPGGYICLNLFYRLCLLPVCRMTFYMSSARKNGL